jgi:MFS transporter, DHA3 family, macrolide efflux protein
MISWSSFPLAFIVSGLLAVCVFEPAMSLGGALAATVGRVLGVGKGSGIGLLYVLVGATTLAIVAVAAATRGCDRSRRSCRISSRSRWRRAGRSR